MQAYTSYHPAAPARISRANPWPVPPNPETVMRAARAAFVYSCRPARPFPALVWKNEQATPRQPLRISTEQIPALTLSAWQEQQQDWQAYQHAPRDMATPPEPAKKAPRKFQRVHDFLDKLIAWRQGL